MTRAVFLLSEIKLHDDLLCSLLLGAVIGDGQSAVASNIANTTYRLQWWDFTKFDLPEISNCEWTNIVELVDLLGWNKKLRPTHTDLPCLFHFSFLCGDCFRSKPSTVCYSRMPSLALSCPPLVLMVRFISQ